MVWAQQPLTTASISKAMASIYLVKVFQLAGPSGLQNARVSWLLGLGVALGGVLCPVIVDQWRCSLNHGRNDDETPYLSQPYIHSFYIFVSHHNLSLLPNLTHHHHFLSEQSARGLNNKGLHAKTGNTPKAAVFQPTSCGQISMSICTTNTRPYFRQCNTQKSS